MEEKNDNAERLGRLMEVDGIFFPIGQPDASLPQWYAELFQSIKEEVNQARRKVMWTANIQMSMMYYHIGRHILNCQKAEGWGAKIVDKLSEDLKRTFPEQRGFSPRNLKYMRKFAEIWQDESIVQRSVAQLSWRHNIVLMEKVKEPNRRLVYAMAAIENGWSYNMLDIHLKAYTVERTGKLPTNFPAIMPDEKSDMIQQLFKDPYLIDFTGADSNSREKDIENGLTTHITNFLLELGQGFSFVGRQIHLEIDGQDFIIDMLFYHLKLRCYIVIELKAIPFDPGMMGQLNMYQAIVDKTLRHETDAPTIGLLLVKSKNETVVKYSLEGFKRPMGIASWQTVLDDELTDKWKSSLPTIEEIEFELNKQ